MISLCRYVIVILPAAFLLGKIFGPVGVWNAFWIQKRLQQSSPLAFTAVQHDHRIDIANILLRINQPLLPNALQNIFQIALCQIICHTQIHVQIIAAVLGGGAGHLIPVVRIKVNISVIRGTTSREA